MLIGLLYFKASKHLSFRFAAGAKADDNSGTPENNAVTRFMQTPRSRNHLGIKHLPLLWACLLWIAGCTGGCSTASSRFFVGIYGGGATTNLPVLRAAGIDLVTGPATKEYLDAAQQAGLRVLASPGMQAGPDFSPKRAQKVVAEWDRHPALWAWYLSDEPDLNQISARQVELSHRTVKSAGAHRPTALVVQHGPALATYHVADILMVDKYPVGWLPLAAYFQHLRHGRVAAKVGHKRLVGVIQAMDWSYYQDQLGPTEGAQLRPPSEEELRCMAYGSRLLGAEGVFFYCFEDGRWNIREHPPTWKALQSVTTEIQRRQALFNGKTEFCNPPLRFPDYQRQYNEALEASVMAQMIEVNEGDGEIPPGKYLVWVNTTGENQTFTLMRPDWKMDTFPHLGSAGSWQKTSSGWSIQLEPYAVRVDGPLVDQIR